MRARTLLALGLAVVLAATVVAWRVLRPDPTGAEGAPAGEHAHGPGAVERPSFDVASARAGAWSDPATWEGGSLPAAGDVVHVRHEVTYDRPRGAAKELWLNAPLRFAPDRATRLTMRGSVVVDRGGLLEMRPEPDRTAVLSFDVADETRMKGGFAFVREDTGLWVLSGGRAELHGRPVRETWSKLAAPASAGSRTVLARGALDDWPRDAEAIVTATNLGREDQTEEVRIVRAERAGDLTRFTLARPLRFDHLGGGELSGEVGLLTHNVRVESVDPKNRAHTFFYGGAAGGISYTQFDRMGPAEQFSRYALHFHVMRGSSRGMEVRGSSFRGSGTFWLNIHASDGIRVVDNVGYRARGAGFYMEHPAGVGNTWLHNLGASVAPSDKLQHRNSVFWFLLGNSLVDNVGVGAHGGADSSGIFLPQQPRDDPALEHPTVVLRNEAHSNRQYGFASWMNLSPEFHVVDLLLWRNADAGFHWGAYGTRFKAFRVRALENGEYDVEARVKGLYLLDSELRGAPIGMFFKNPVVNTNPENPSRIVRSRFADHAAHDVAIDDARKCERTTGRCPPMYLQFVDPALASDSPVRFGWQWDERTRLWFQSAEASARGDLPETFVLVREDQPKPSPSAVRDDGIGAWVVPDEPVLDDLPPVARAPRVAGSTVALGASDDGSVERLELLVNGVRVGQGAEVTLDPEDLPPYAVLTVKATDDAGQVAYSPSIVLV